MANGNLRHFSLTIFSPTRFSHDATAARQFASRTHGNGQCCRDSTASVRLSVAASAMAALLALGGWVPGARLAAGGADTPAPADLYAKAIAQLHPLWQSRLYAVALTRAKKLAAESQYAASPKVAKSIQEDAEALVAFWQAVRAGAAKLKPGAPFRMRGMLCKVVRVSGDVIHARAGSAELSTRLSELREADLVALARDARPLTDARSLLALALLELHTGKPSLDAAQAALARASGAGADVSLHRALLETMAAKQASEAAAKPRPRKMTPWGAPFNGKSLRGWQPNSASWWSVRDGEIAVHVGNKDATLVYTRTLYDDFVLEVEVKNLSIGPRFGVLFRKRVSNYISFCLNDQFDDVGCKAGDNLWRASLKGVTIQSHLPETVSIDTGRWYKLRVVCEGERFRCYVNGKLVIEGTDRVLQRGYVGLCARRADARFRRLRIRRILAPAAGSR